MRPDKPQPNNTDSLREFVNANRDAFDTEMPSASVWASIEADLDPEFRSIDPVRSRQASAAPAEEGSIVRQLYPYFRKAAIASMLLAIGILGGMLLAGERNNTSIAEQTIEQRALEIENYYQREIDRRLQLVESYRPEPQLRRELASMSQLEVREDAELSSVAPGNQRAILEAMASEYQAKLDALEHVLSQLRAAEQTQINFNQPGPRSQEQL